jgi:anti-sigma factor RsiW
MKEHPHSRHISAFLDGDLSPSETLEMENHVAVCACCASLLKDLGDLREQARDLPELSPPRDLWPEIARAIQDEDARNPDVIRLHASVPVQWGPKRRGLHLSVPQAVAAGLALALFSGLAGARVGQVASTPALGPGQEGPVDSPYAWVSSVGEVSPALEATALEVAQLEEELEERSGEMDSFTVEILERNLAAIDRAIRDLVTALKADPDNRYLGSNLARAVSTRGRYLQDATALVFPTT